MIYGLLGRKLGHSFSKSYFTDFFERNGIDASYLNFELPDIGDLMELLAEYPDIRGFNVTIPYKEQILPYLTSISPAARDIGAVNVVKVDHSLIDGSPQLHGFNTDYIGFRDSLTPLLGEGHDRAALVLGTGGASHAVVAALKALSVKTKLVSRRSAGDVITYDDLTPEIMSSHPLIVNATPLGMYPDVDSCPPIPYDLLSPSHLCYDLTYNPPVTMFMRNSAQRGAAVKNGLDMLHRQAIAAWSIWQAD